MELNKNENGLEIIGTFDDDRKEYYRDNYTWTPEEIDRHIILFSKKKYNWESDNDYWKCLTNIFSKFYLVDKEHIDRSLIYHRVKKTLKYICSQKYYDGNPYDIVLEHIEDKTFFDTFFDKKNEFTKIEIVEELILNILIQISLVSVFHHNGKHFWEKDAIWIQSINIGEPDPKIWKITK